MLGEFNAGDCQLDEQVEFSVPEEVIVRGSFIVYFLPLLSCVAGALLGSATLSGLGADLAAIVGAAAGFVGGVSLVRLHAAIHRQDPTDQPTLLRRLVAAAPLVATTATST